MKENTYMNYEKFLELLISELEERFVEEVYFSHSTVEKANGVSLHALVISNGKVNISPAIYLDFFFKNYCSGKFSLSQIADEITDIYHKGAFEHDFDATIFTDYSKVKTNLGAHLVNTVQSQNLLAHVPHRNILDLSIIYSIYPESGESEETWSIQVKNAYLDVWGVTEEDLYQ